MAKNRGSLNAEKQLGRFFFHHAFLYLPIVQTVHGLQHDGNSLPAQYGLGLTRTMATLLKWSGETTFQEYFKLYWIAPGLYVILASLLVLFFTRQVSLATATGVLIVGLLPFQSIDGLRLAPGFNPLRHLPDLICFGAVGIYAIRQTIASMLLRAGSIALLCWWNREFGFFMLAGSLVWFTLELASSRAHFKRIMLCALLEVCACALVLANLSSVGDGNSLGFYNLLGVGAPITKWREVGLTALVWVLMIGMAAIAKFRQPMQSRVVATEVGGVGIGYAAFASIYAIWNPSPGHFSVVWVCASVPVICLCHWGIEVLASVIEVPKYWLRAYLALILSSFAIISSVSAAVSTEALFSNQAKSHLMFEWKFPGIEGTSSADPGPISEAIGLLEEQQADSPLVLISRFDVLLQIASGRVASLPFVDLPSSVIGWPVIDQIASEIARLHPKVIFMDRDIFSNREWQLLGEKGGFEHSSFYLNAFLTPGLTRFDINSELRPVWAFDPSSMDDLPRGVSASYHRVGHLAALGILARQVSACYRPGPVGGVIQAWYRTC